MKNIEIPFDKKIECVCGTKYEWELEDLKIKRYSQIEGCYERYYTEIYVECPFCQHRCTIKEIRE